MKDTQLVTSPILLEKYGSLTKARFLWAWRSFTLTFDLVSLSLCHLQRYIDIYFMIEIQWFVDDLKPKQHFHLTAYLTLTFWPCATFNVAKISIIYMCKSDQDPIIRSWIMDQKIFTHNSILDYDPWPLVNFNVSLVYILCIIFTLKSKLLFMIYGRKTLEADIQTDNTDTSRA